MKTSGKEIKLKHMQKWIQNVLDNKVEFVSADDEPSTSNEESIKSEKQEL